MIKPLYAILIDHGFMTKKLFGQFARLPEADDIVAECDRIMALPRAARQLSREPREMTDDDFELDLSQKGVDMRVGMDMARLSLREMVRTIVVVTGDSDFVPAFKFIRREGVRVILDPMGHNVRTELRQHADIVV